MRLTTVLTSATGHIAITATGLIIRIRDLMPIATPEIDLEILVGEADITEAAAKAEEAATRIGVAEGTDNFRYALRKHQL